MQQQCAHIYSKALDLGFRLEKLLVNMHSQSTANGSNFSPFPKPQPLPAAARVRGKQASDGRTESLSEPLHRLTSGAPFTSLSVGKVFLGLCRAHPARPHMAALVPATGIKAGPHEFFITKTFIMTI